MSRGFKIFLVIFFGLMLWITIVDSFYTMPLVGVPFVIALIVAMVVLIRRIVRAR